MPGDVVPEVRSASKSAVSADKEHWTVGDLAEIYEEEQVGSKRYLCKEQDLCRAKRRKALASLPQTVGFAVGLIHDAEVISFLVRIGLLNHLLTS